MQVEISYDKIVLSHDEVQLALRDYIAKHMPHRIVRGDIVTSHAQRQATLEDQLASSRRLNVTVGSNDKVQKCMPCVTTAAHCYLEPVVPESTGNLVLKNLKITDPAILKGVEQ